MPARLRIYVYAVIAAGLVVIAYGLPRAASHPTEWWRVAVATAIFLLGDAALLHLRFGRDRYSFTWSEVAVVIGLALLPLGWLRLVSFVGVALAHAFARRAPVKVLFNAAAFAVGTALARLTVEASGVDVHSPDNAQAWVVLASGSFVFFIWNTLSVAGAVALSQKVSILSVLDRGLALKAVVWLGNTAIGVLIVALAALQPAALLMLPILLGALYGLYRGYLRAIQENDVWAILQDASRNLLRTDRGELGRTVCESAATLFGGQFVELVLPGGVEGQRGSRYRHFEDGHFEERSGDLHDLAGTYWGRVICDREPFELSTTKAPSAQRAELEELAVHHCVVAPLIVENRCLGALRVGFANRGSMKGRELQVFTTFANSVSAAAHNALLFDEVRERALRDPLTGLPNRALIEDRLQQAITRTERNGGRVAVLFLDLDRFKVINDSLGHQVGDDLLVSVSSRIRTVMRGSDTAGRFGGDEFVVLCEDIANEDVVLDVAQRLVDAFAEPFTLQGENVFLSASVGIAVASGGTCNATALVRDADAAMYKAKERGRNRFELFDSEMRSMAVSRLEIERSLRHAVENNELELYFQPTVDIATQRVIGAEALLRWQREDGTFVGPETFIRVAEETGMIRSIGAWVLEDACAQLAKWKRMLSTARPFTLAVNLSAHQIADSRIVDEVASILRSSKIEPEWLCLEITESALLHDLDAALDVVGRLRALGVRIALDDFGTGYSSLRYLQQLPVDVLKIDRSFISRLGPGSRDSSIVARMIDLAHALDLEVVAEGVETPGQLAELASMKCEVAQGFYFSAAQSGDAFTRTLDDEIVVDIEASTIL